MSVHPSSSCPSSRRASRLLGVCASLGVAFPALAANGIGSVAGLSQSVTGAVSGTHFVPVSYGDEVKQNETVRTDASGEARLTLVDYTDLTIFRRSSIRLDRFILENPNRARSVVMSTSDGTFAFNSGQSPGAYLINTSAGTLTPQGTKFTFTVHGGSLRLDVDEGAVRFCPRGKSQAYCVVATPGHPVLGRAGAPAQVLGMVDTPTGPAPPVNTGALGPQPNGGGNGQCYQAGRCVPSGCSPHRGASPFVPAYNGCRGDNPTGGWQRWHNGSTYWTGQRFGYTPGMQGFGGFMPRASRIQGTGWFPNPVRTRPYY